MIPSPSRVATRHLQANGPTEIQSIVDHLYETGEIDFRVKVEYFDAYHGTVEIQLNAVDDSGKFVADAGKFFTSKVVNESDSLARAMAKIPAPCAESYRKVRRRYKDVNLWVVSWAYLHDKRLWHHGIGLLAYEQILQEAGKFGAVVAPHWCSQGGSTTDMAQRVWDSLKRKGYESEGPIIIPKNLPHPQQRTGGIFEGPPAMVRSIQNWMLSVYAGHVLVGVQAQIAQVQDATRPVREALAQIEEVERTFEDRIRDLGPDEAVRFSLPIVYDREIRPSFLGISRSKYGGNVPYQVGEGEKNVSYKMADWRDLEDAISAISGRVVARKERAIRTLKWLEKLAPAQKDTTLVELNLLKRECLQYTSKAKSYVSKVSTMIPLDLTGWKYVGASSPLIAEINIGIESQNTVLESNIRRGEAHLIKAQAVYDKLAQGKTLTPKDEASLQQERDYYWNLYRVYQAQEDGKRPSVAYAPVSILEHGHYTSLQVAPIDQVRTYLKPLLSEGDIMGALRAKEWAEIKATLFFTEHTSRGGQWSVGPRELELDAHQIEATTLKAFREGVAWITETVRHEVQHLGQDLLKIILGLKEDAGLPSRSIREQGTDAYGRVDLKTKKMLEHDLRDVEMMTELADSVGQFLVFVKRVHREDIPAAIRGWVGLPSDLIRIPGDPRPLRVGAHRAFRLWKKENPGKWRKAVSEFVKALGEHGIG